MGFEVVVGRKYSGTEELLLEDVHKLQEVLGVAVADVVHGIRRHGQSVFAHLFLGGFHHHSDNAFYDVVYIGEVALAVAVVENLDLLALHQFIGEAEVGHVGTTCRAIDGEESKAGAGDVVESYFVVLQLQSALCIAS